MKEITLEDIAEAIKNGDRSDVNEASLGRVYQHIQKDASESFAILTAFRGGLPKRENIKRNKQLQSDVRSLGYGFFKVKGYWQECEDSELEYEDCPEDLKVPVVEDSLFVPNISRKEAVRLAKKYEQDAIVYQGEETNDKVEIISKEGKTVDKLGKFNPNKIAQGYTKIKGKNFTFEGFQYKPTGQLSGMLLNVLLGKG